MFSFLNHETVQSHQGVYRAYLNSLNNQSIYNNENTGESTTKKSSFALRFFISLLIFCVYLSLSGSLRQQVHEYVTADYSKNLFAFMSDLAYTLKYEKIGIE